MTRIEQCQDMLYRGCWWLRQCRRRIGSFATAADIYIYIYVCVCGVCAKSKEGWMYSA